MQTFDLETSSCRVHGTKIEAPKRYTVLELVGQGAYGVVCSAQDEEQKEAVAVKKIENAFEELIVAKRTLRELRILRHLRHENVIGIRNMYLPGKQLACEDVYVVTELMETDLASILKSRQPVTDDHVQFFVYQILRGIKYIHSAEIIHRDLKPRNLLVNSNCDLKICDFGLARVNLSMEKFMACHMTEYVCTRWYRAPEVLCCCRDYGKAIDMWSVGCILAEMLRRKPLFPGKNTQHQLQIIISCLGAPEKHLLNRISNDKCRRFMEALPSTGGRALEDAFKGSNKEALELLKSTLSMNPDKRITAEQALQTEFLKELHCPEDEPTCTPVDLSEFEFELRKIDIDALRHEMFLESLQYQPEKRERYLEEQIQSVKTYSVADYPMLASHKSQYTSEEEDTVEMKALRNDEDFHEVPQGVATIEQSQLSRAGMNGSVAWSLRSTRAPQNVN